MRCLLALLSLCFVGCGTAQTGAVRIDPALARLVPARTILLAGVKVDDLRATDWYKRWAGQQPLPGLESFASETGLDPRQDVSELLIASDGVNTAVLARGSFSPARIEVRLQRQGGRRMPCQGCTMVGNEQAAVAFLDSNTALAGRPAAIRLILGERGRSNGLPALLRSQLGAIPAQNQVWIAAGGGFGELAKTAPQTGNLSNLGRVFSMLESGSAGVDLRAGLRLFATGVCHSEQDARSLGDAVRGVVGLARLSTPLDAPELLKVCDAVQVEQRQRTVRVYVALSQELLDKALAKLPRGPGRASNE
jgi:hypothetical protein